VISVAPIVEGHGEVSALRILLVRIWTQLLRRSHLDVLQPIRQPRSKLVQDEELLKAVDLASLKLGARASDGPSRILLVLDADDDPPCKLGPKLVRTVSRERRHLAFSTVVAQVEYETWFVAAADSLTDFLDVPLEAPEVRDPEAARCRKAWIMKHFRRGRYSETVDQPRMTAAMDLSLCRSRSPSFDKLCRELEKLPDR